jgi:hypothetical protein
MVRTAKSEKQSAAPVSEPVKSVPAEQPVSKRVSKKASAPVVVEVPFTPSVPEVVEVPLLPSVPTLALPSAEADSSMAVKLLVFGAKIQQLSGIMSSLKSDFKTLEKMVGRELKNAQKASSRKKKASGNRQPSGFVKPTRISDELAQFLGKTIGTEMARTEVSKEINGYIRTNSLQDPANGRKINADTKLSTLLKLQKDDELTYFNLQRYMKHHFIKAELTPAAVV